jgi:hypothetical protein
MDNTLRVIPHLQCANKPSMVVVAIKVGNSFWVTHRTIPNQAISDGLVKVEEFSNTFSRRVTALADLVMTVEGLHQSKEGCSKVFHVRIDRHSDKNLVFAKSCNIPEVDLRRYISALKRNNIPRIQVLNRFEISEVLIYPNFNEIAIADIDSISQLTGWIVDKKELEDMISPPKPVNLSDANVDPLKVADLKIAAGLAAKEVKKAEKKAIRAEMSVKNALQKACDARKEFNTTLKAAKTALTAYNDALSRVTTKR